MRNGKPVLTTRHRLRIKVLCALLAAHAWGRAFASFPTTLIFRSGIAFVRCGSQFLPLLKISVVNSLANLAHFACGTHPHALVRDVVGEHLCASARTATRCVQEIAAIDFPAIPPPVVASRDEQCRVLLSFSAMLYHDVETIDVGT